MTPERAISMRYRCFICRAHATIHVFSGVYGGGFPACDTHRLKAMDAALRAILTTSSIPLVAGYTVRAFSIVYDEYGSAARGHLLWSARPRLRPEESLR